MSALCMEDVMLWRVINGSLTTGLMHHLNGQIICSTVDYATINKKDSIFVKVEFLLGPRPLERGYK